MRGRGSLRLKLTVSDEARLKLTVSYEARIVAYVESFNEPLSFQGN
jgi:starvation-inducible outer membrane lipoprotein